jgi:hypothetical protein
MTSLTYHESPTLTKEALSALIDIVPVLYNTDSSEAYQKYEEIMEKGILQGLVYAMGDKHALIQVSSSLFSLLCLINADVALGRFSWMECGGY